MEFFCDSGSLGKGSEGLLFTVHSGLGRASFLGRPAGALWQHLHSLDRGLAASEDHVQ